MEIYKGEAVSGGVAIGRIFYYKNSGYSYEKPVYITDVDGELERLDKAIDEAKKSLESLYESSRVKISDESAEVFTAHKMMLQDDDFISSMHNLVKNEGVCAEHAVYKTGKAFAEKLASLEGQYMKERAGDVKDVSARVIRILKGEKELTMPKGERVILLADDLSPAETAALDKDYILAIATRAGSSLSHTAVLARGMGIPAAVRISVSEEMNGEYAALDGDDGILYISPDEKTEKELSRRSESKKKKLDAYRQLIGKENVTPRGERIELFATIGSAEEAKIALENDAGGIGLFRSEFIFMGEQAPSEEEQFSVYREILNVMKGKKVIIRVLDAGADKSIPCLYQSNGKREENPALGVRGIRLLLREKALFKCQLRALLRAAAYGELWIMIPMVASLSELEGAKELLCIAKSELEREKAEFGEVKLGMMVETPASAIMIEDFIGVADFFSIGTNDLIQYTLAADRTNESLSTSLSGHHPAVLSLIERVCRVARENSVWVGICGELASDATLAHRFISWGASELSVAPLKILPLRAAIRAESIPDNF